ncbi:hypothetical protein P9112_012695 [Eukaryota sp. TZLM1-RC]
MLRFKAFFAFLLFLHIATAITCRNERNQPVDWFFVYKLPIIPGYRHLDDGFGYAYYDSSMKDTLLTVTDRSLKDSMSLSHTLAPIYTKQKENLAFGMYNDDTPYGTASSGYGHVKGVVATDQSHGFWLIHSTPRYPFNSTETYEFPDYAKIYGQSFLCVSMPTKEFNKVGVALKTMRPKLYETFVPSYLSSKLPSLVEAFEGEYENLDTSNDLTMFSLKGMSFRHFSKSAKWGRCIYHDLISISLKDDLFIENWMRPWVDSFCKPEYQYNNLNIKTIDFGSGRSFGYTKDHSKWAMTPNNDWVCIGDMNRMTSQYKRGGGFMCFRYKSLYTAMKNVVSEVDSCN